MKRATKSALQGIAMLSLCLAALVFAGDERQLLETEIHNPDHVEHNAKPS